MSQYMRKNLSSISTARSIAAAVQAVPNRQFSVQPGESSKKVKRLKEVSRDESGYLDDLQIEHPLAIAYVSTCKEGNCMIYVGPQIALLGFTQEAWLVKPDLRLEQIHKEDFDRVKAAVQHSRNTAEKFNCHYRLYDSAGKMHWIHDEANVVCDESGEPLFIAGTMRDITEMKIMEEELNQHRYYLERKVEQRTEQLARRITLLESCNATLCEKLAQARRDLVALHKQLASTMPSVGSNDCLEQLTGISDGAKQRIEPDIRMAG